MTPTELWSFSPWVGQFVGLTWRMKNWTEELKNLYAIKYFLYWIDDVTSLRRWWLFLGALGRYGGHWVKSSDKSASNLSQYGNATWVCYKKKQDAWRRLRGTSLCKHIKLLMRSDNHSLFVHTNKLVCKQACFLLQLKWGHTMEKHGDLWSRWKKKKTVFYRILDAFVCGIPRKNRTSHLTPKATQRNGKGKPADKTKRQSSFTHHSSKDCQIFQHHTANSPFLLPHITYSREEENFLTFWLRMRWYYKEKFDADHYWNAKG